MKKLLLLLGWSACVSGALAQPSPRQLYPGLFEAVQLQRVYPDGKTFVDALPREAPPLVMQAYEREKNLPGFNLKAFVAAHFVAPPAATGAFQSNTAAGLRRHLDTLWTVLRRVPAATPAPYSSLVPLPRPYVVPGGRFREVYYWDSYFTMLGLQESGRLDVVRDMTDNFAYLIGRYGFVPNGNRTYYLTRSQPPFFSLMVRLLAQQQGDSVLRRYLPALQREYAYWMAGADSLAPGAATRRAVRLPGGEILNRYWDTSDQPREESYAEDVAAAKLSTQPPAQFYRHIRAAAASGWDFSARWFGPAGTLVSIRTTDFVPVDLNSLLYHLEETLAQAHTAAGQASAARTYERAAQRRRQAVQKYCWDATAGWFVDYDWSARRPATARTLAGTFPLAFKLATPAQAGRVAAGLKADFLQPGGLRTTLTASGQQWDAPNAWAPLQYMAVDGLEHYGQSTLARDVATRWIELNTAVFQQTGKLMEKYNVADPSRAAGGGEYPLQDGFGWTNGVLLKLLNKYPPVR